MTVTAFTEQIDLTEAKFDQDSRTIKGVILIKAGMSANRRNYSPEVLQKAVSVFESAKAYDDHSHGSRRVSEITGWYENVHYKDGAIRADRVFSRTDAGRNVQSVAEDILSGKAPKSLAGLSINAVGQGKVVRPQKDDDSKDYFEVESITSALSVDDVTEPAAGGAYLTASSGDPLIAALLSAMTYEDWQTSRPDYLDRQKNEWKSVRQTEAIKAAQSDTEALKAELSQTKALLQSVEIERDSALALSAKTRRESIVDKALQKVSLPGEWIEDLRERLLATDESQWTALIDVEKRKAEAIKLQPRPKVEGAGQQISASILAKPANQSPGPLPNEDVAAWIKRLQS